MLMPHPGVSLANHHRADAPALFFQELSRQQRSFQTLDQERIQVKARLTQELQQAKNMHNVLQAELDKVGTVSLSPQSSPLVPCTCYFSTITDI